MERDVGEGNLATAAASALAAAAVKAKVTQAAVIAPACFYFDLKGFFSVLSEALGCSGREEDQISGGSAGRDADEEAGDQTAAL